MPEPDRSIEIHASGERITFLKTAAETGGGFLEMEVSLKVGGQGPPLHIHLQQTEEFDVLAGVAGFQVGRERVEAEVGGRRVVPPGTPHTWWNAGIHELLLHAVLRPALGTEAMLRGVFAAANRHRAPLPGPFDGARWMLRVRGEYQLVHPPWLIQRGVFPLVVVLGQLLGKYRGEEAA
jgi:mannose-6-phosphate isomerase-like protein (cupin superfamily)